MNYEKIYHNLCHRGKYRSKNNGLYLEKHHIIPVFFFRNNKRNLRYNDGIFEGDGEHPENITYLTAREHFVAHVLLCKIWSNTKWYHRCSSSLIMFFNKEESKHPRKKNFNPGQSKKYERYAILAKEAISAERKGKMPVKDVQTGEMIGSVSIKHPKVLSGEWVHHSKDKKLTDETICRMKAAMKGTGNSNSKYTDEELIESYLKCCRYFEQLVSKSLWVLYSERNDNPYLKFIKDFRFSNRGFQGLLEEAQERLGYSFPDVERPFYTKQYRKMYKEYKQRVNKN